MIVELNIREPQLVEDIRCMSCGHEQPESKLHEQPVDVKPGVYITARQCVICDSRELVYCNGRCGFVKPGFKLFVADSILQQQLGDKSPKLRQLGSVVYAPIPRFERV